MRKKQTLHKQDYWDEIFESISMDFFPIEYVDTIIVTFDDNEVWEIDVRESANEEGVDAEHALQDFFDEYNDTITQVDFRLDLQRVKKDISKRTARFMKLNK